MVRVHPELLEKQHLPKIATEDIWEQRFKSIRAFERHLHNSGTKVLKFFLHVSKEEQRKRFLERLEQPDKNWKFSLADIDERKLWDKYHAAYQDLVRHTSAKHAPWIVVPADHKWFGRVVISSAIVDALDRLNLHFPVVAKDARDELQKVRAALEKEGLGRPAAPRKHAGKV